MSRKNKRIIQGKKRRGGVSKIRFDLPSKGEIERETTKAEKSNATESTVRSFTVSKQCEALTMPRPKIPQGGHGRMRVGLERESR